MNPEPYLVLWRWWLADPRKPGKRYLSKHHMGEADALATDPTAQREETTRMTVDAPGRANSTAWFADPPPHGG